MVCHSIFQGCKNPGCHVVLCTEVCAMAPNICGSSVWELVSCYTSVSLNFEVAHGFFFGKFCKPIA